MKKNKHDRLKTKDVTAIMNALKMWQRGEIPGMVTWQKLEIAFGFSRQAMSGNDEIKDEYDIAKLAKDNNPRIPKDVSEDELSLLQNKIQVLEDRVKGFKGKENEWLARWQRIAYHVRGKGIQMSHVDSPIPADMDPPSKTKTAEVLRPFDEDIPSTGRV